MRAKLSSLRGVSLLELLVVIFALAILGAGASAYYTSFKSAVSETKLESDVVAVNQAIRVYLANGGTLAGVSDPQAILDKLKTTRANPETYAGLRGATLDARLQASAQTESEALSDRLRAFWNADKQRFETRRDGDAAISHFLLDAGLGAMDYGTEERENTTLAYNESDGWIWAYQDSATTPGEAPTPVLVSPLPNLPGGAPAVAPSRLGMPVFLPPGGTFDYIDFPKTVTIEHGNDPSYSQVYYATAWSAAGVEWQAYDGSAISLLPGMQLRAYVASTSPSVLDSFTKGAGYLRKHFGLESPEIVTSEPTMSLESDGEIAVTLVNDNPSNVPQRLEFSVNGEEWQLYNGPMRIRPSSFPAGYEISARVAGAGEQVDDSDAASRLVPISLRTPLVDLSAPKFVEGVDQIRVTLTNPNPEGSSRMIYRVADVATGSWSSWSHYTVALTLNHAQFPGGFKVEAITEPLSSRFLESELAGDEAGSFFGVELSGKTIFVLDTSGSMQWNERLERVKEEMMRSLDALPAHGKFAIIQFSESASVVYSWAGATPGNVAAAKAQVLALRAAGGTNYSDALKKARDIVRTEKDVEQVIFLSDGQPTRGDTEPAKILREVDRIVAAGARLDAIGFEVPTEKARQLLEEMDERGAAVSETPSKK